MTLETYKPARVFQWADHRVAYMRDYPHVMRAIVSRRYDVDKIVSGADEHHARARVHAGGMTVYGAISVDHVHTLTEDAS